jgi:hypothetical protein
MHHTALTQIESPGPVVLATKWRTAFIACAVIGVAAFAGGLAVDAARAWQSYLVSYFMFACFGVFGLFFTALHHAVNATWVIVVRRVAEGLTAYLPIALVLFLVMIPGLKYIYPWATPDFVTHYPAKREWLSVLWVSVRGIVFILVWMFFAWKLVRMSLKQDETGEPSLTRKMIYWSIAFMPFFAGTFSMTSFDQLMSLEPKWYSTMFPVYCFAGMFQSGLALITIIFIMLRRQGALRAVTTPSHLKDLGTLVFAFTIFMTYIGFSQYMLIWYANLPEETFYFIKRSEGGWQYLFIALPVFKFVIPFFGLLSQGLKRMENWLLMVCGAILIGQYLDIFWMVRPSVSGSAPVIGWIEIGTFLGFAGLFGLAVSWFYGKYSVLASRDPRIIESANWRFWE